MVNRSIEQKIRKMKRRGRFATFSGKTARFAARIDRGRIDKEGNFVVIPVGPIHLSKTVMSTGRGPDQERMQSYYQRLNSFDEALPKTLGMTFEGKGMTTPMCELALKYKELVKEHKNMFVRLLDDELATLDMFFASGKREFFFVEMDKRKKTLRRSMVYSKREYAMACLNHNTITWVEALK